MNLHDADGVKPYDDKFVNLCHALGLDPNTTKEIPNEICSSLKYAHGLEDLVVKPLEDMGVDFWWIDW